MTFNKLDPTFVFPGSHPGNVNSYGVLKDCPEMTLLARKKQNFLVFLGIILFFVCFKITLLKSLFSLTTTKTHELPIDTENKIFIFVSDIPTAHQKTTLEQQRPAVLVNCFSILLMFSSDVMYSANTEPNTDTYHVNRQASLL